MSSTAAGDMSRPEVQAGSAARDRLGPGPFIALGLLSMFAPLSIDMYLPALPHMMRSLHTSASIAQLTLTACLIGISAGPLLTGPLSDRFGRRRPLLTGISIYIVASLACSLAPTIWVLIAVRFVQGVSGSAGIVISLAIVRDLRSGNAAAKLMAMLALISGAAPAAAPVIGAQLLRLGSWRDVFLTLAIAGTAILAMAIVFVPESLQPERRRIGGVATTIAGFGELLRDRVFVGYTIAQGLVTGAMFAYISGSPFVLENIFRLSPQEFSGVFAMNALGLVVAAQSSAAVVGRFGARRMMRVGIVGEIIGATALLIVVCTHGPLWQLLVCLFIVVSNNSVVGPNSQAVAMTSYPHLAGSAAALIALARFAVGGIVAPLVGLGGSHDALPMAIVIFALGCGSSSVTLALGRTERHVERANALIAAAGSSDPIAS